MHGMRGKLPARADSVKLRFSHVFNASALPTPPLVFGHQNLMAGGNWFMLGNDAAGDCVFAGAAHETMLWSMEGGAPRARFTIRDVLSDYSALTGYVPGEPSTDQGTDMQVAASYRRTIGVIDAVGARHRIKAYVALTKGNLGQIALAAWLFGAVGIGFDLPDTADQQFDEGRPWDVVPLAKSAGGHYVPLVGRDPDGNFLVITWGRVQRVTPAFIAAYMDEGIAYLSDEILSRSTKLSPENFNEDLLNAYLEGLSHAG